MTGFPPTPWVFPAVDGAEPEGVVAIGADLAPGTLLHGYSRGLFPMPIERGGPIGWWSPDPRAVLELDELYISSSTKKALRRYTTTVNQDFHAVVEACGDPAREHGWIDEQIVEAYTELHRLGWAHSVEVWADDALVGGIYGVGIDRFFAGESMFHRRTNASKVALVRLVDVLRQARVELFDVQWQTDHLASLGVREIPRQTYLDRLRAAVRHERPLALAANDAAASD